MPLLANSSVGSSSGTTGLLTTMSCSRPACGAARATISALPARVASSLAGARSGAQRGLRLAGRALERKYSKKVARTRSAGHSACAPGRNVRWHTGAGAAAGQPRALRHARLAATAAVPQLRAQHAAAAQMRRACAGQRQPEAVQPRKRAIAASGRLAASRRAPASAWPRRRPPSRPRHVQASGAREKNADFGCADRAMRAAAPRSGAGTAADDRPQHRAHAWLNQTPKCRLISSPPESGWPCGLAAGSAAGWP